MRFSKSIYFIFLFSFIFFTSCDTSEKISISGQIENAGNVKTVTFYEGERKLDSVFLSDNNRFQFERSASQPRLLTLKVGSRKYPLIVEPGKKIEFYTDMMSSDRNYSVGGSELSEKLKNFFPYQLRKQHVEDSLQNAFVEETFELSGNEVENKRAEFLGVLREHLSSYNQRAVEFADKNNDLAGFYVMSTLDPEMAEEELIAYADKIEGKFENNRFVNDFLKEIEKLKRLAVGQPAPDFKAHTPDNKMVGISDYKGTITLVDFWASWCGPCRKENPNIVAQYNKYKDKGFDVLGISLDDNPGSWLKAIDDDKLEWTQISDLKAWSSDLIDLYAITAIPTSFILDENGLIIAKNLRGNDLGDFLKAKFE